MDTVIRYVGEIERDQRLWLESAFGRRLQDDQQVIIQVLAPGCVQTAEARQAAFAELKRLSEQGTRHREAIGVTDEDADAILDEAMNSVRQRPSQ